MKNKDHRGVYNQFDLKHRKLIAKGIKKECQQYDSDLRRIEIDPRKTILLDTNGKKQEIKEIWRSRRFMAQLYQNGDWLRISVNRTEYLPEQDCWREGISWDDLMEVKAQMGFSDWDAIEIYPRDSDVVNVTNMRHLWIVPGDVNIDCIWRTNSD